VIVARKLLGTTASLVSRTRVYLTDGAVEIDEIEGYIGTRRRVLFDEVLLVTLDRRRRASSLVLWMAMALLSSTPGVTVALMRGGTPAGFVVALAFAVPFTIGFVLHLALGLDYVTVFGKRSLAQMAFSLRKARAREVFVLLRERVQEAQERERRRAAESAPPVPGGSTLPCESG